MSTRRRRIRSIVVRVVVFLLLGAVVNVAVAWGLALRPYPEAQRMVCDQFPGLTHTVVLVYATGEFGIGQQNQVSYEPYLLNTAVIDEATYRNLVPQWSACSTSDPSLAFQDGIDAYVSFGEWAFGWPQLSLHYTQRLRIDVVSKVPSQETSATTIPRALAESLFGDRARNEVPTTLIWPGFAINTFFYATILWLLFAFPFTVRRWRRIRCGLCAKCAYPIGASDVCTECGASVKRVA